MTTQVSLSPRAWTELLLLSAVWGASFLAFAIALREVGVFTTVLHRVFWAAVLLWALVPVLKIGVPRTTRQWGACFVMGALNNVIPFSLIVWGQKTIESGLAAILNSTTALFGVVLAAILFADERVTWNRGIGVTLGFTGVVIAIGWDALAGFDIRSLAQLAILGAALSYAFASVWARRELSGLDPKGAALGMLTASSMIMMPLALAVDGWPTLDLSLSTLAALAYLSVAATALAYLLYYRVLAMAGAANLMLTTLLIPPIAILLGAFVLDETLSASALLGFVLLGLGLLVMNGRIRLARKPA